MLHTRRDFLYAAGIASASIASAETQAPWRTFEITTRVEVLKPSGVTRIWIPAALTNPTPFQKPLASSVNCAGGKYRSVESKPDSLRMVAAEFPSGAKAEVTLTDRIATRNCAVDLTARSHPRKPSSSELQYFLQPTRLIPTDGIVKQTALEITSRASTEVDKARAIYEWIVENTYRNPKTRGCGLGNIKFMLESHDLGGKCADLNALFVGLCRATGLPARDVYGIRIAKSELGYKSLGASSNVISKAQHCRAEVYLSDFGWTPVDPADVRKVVLEEPPGNRPIDDQMVKQARARLFGSWEMNWMGYNFGHDVALPGSSRQIGFLMYPQAETAEGPTDSLDPDTFRYEITSREIV
jgi:transglutaminase-like putative cysteine protease